MLKRAFDIGLSLFGLLLCAPLFVLVAALVKLGSKGPVFFRHQRVGRGFRPFHVLKFRTMVQDAPRLGGPLTVGNDPRVTRVGRVLRKTKLDELPQLLNVLWGEMSFVGPRPEAGKYVELFRADYEEILRARPGITDLASLKFRDEESVLAQAANPEQEYIQRVLPEKLRLAREYLQRQSLLFDVAIIARTVGGIVADRFQPHGNTQIPATQIPAPQIPATQFPAPQSPVVPCAGGAGSKAPGQGDADVD